MRKITWFVAAAVVVLVLTGLGAWTSVGRSTHINALVGSTVHRSAMTGAKVRPTLHYDDYSLVFY